MPEQEKRSNGFIKRVFSNLEPNLQFRGVVITFIFLHVLLNIIVFFITAAPVWRVTGEEHTAFRIASAAARGAGAMINLDSAIIILVAAKTMMTYLRQTILNLIVPFDKAMPSYHILVGNTLVFATLLHCFAHIVRYIMVPQDWYGFMGAISLGISGGILTLTLLSMRITSLLQVRKKSFETFHFVHHGGLLVYFILLIMHGSHKKSHKTWMYVIFPICVYLIDRLIRLKREDGAQALVGPRSINVSSPDIVCLRLPRLFDYRAGQYCDVRVPEISNLQWHPFTIASSPHENEMRFYIKVTGDWTRALHKLFTEQTKDDSIKVDLRGPFGAPAEHVGQYEHVVLISGGVGATPMASIAKHAHYWIMNYTERGAIASKSVSAAFTRNQSVQGTPSVPGTPTRNVSSIGRSRNASRPISRNQSTNFSRNISRDMSRDISRNFSRNASRTGSRPISRSGSGKLERFNSSRIPAVSVGVPITRSASGQTERFNSSRPVSGRMSRSESGRIDRYNSGSSNMERAGSNKTADSVTAIVHEQRLNQPYGPNRANMEATAAPSRFSQGYDASPLQQQQQPSSYLGPFPNSSDAVVPEGLRSPARSIDDVAMRSFIPVIDSDHALSEADLDDEDNEFTRPDDYDEDLGNPSLPIPDRRANQNFGESPSQSGNKRLFEETGIEIDNHIVFDEDEQQVEEEQTSLNRDDIIERGFQLDEIDGLDLEAGQLDEDGIELENEILRDHNTASNAFNLLGVSFGPNAMIRHMEEMDAKKLRSSIVRTSTHLMSDAIEASGWADRILFYLHTVTVNWVMLWLMMLRFTMVFIGLPLGVFSFNQSGLGVFSSSGMNITDLVFSVLITIPVLGAIVMEIYISSIQKYLADNIANSFDLFVMLPLLFICTGLHVLNLCDIGKPTEHISKLTVCFIWPVIGLFLVWRIARVIGSRVVLAPSYRSSHAQTKSLDYIWVGKTHEDDSWLVEELLPLAESNIIRLHRFITRQAPKVENWTLDYEKVPLKTTYSRPDWDEVFGGLVERSKSGAVIGVFFCGQDSMARMIQQAAMRAMSKSMENAFARGYFSKKAGAANIASHNNMAAVGSHNANALGGGPPPGVSLDDGLGGAANGIRANGGSVRSVDGPRSNFGRVGSINGPQSQRPEDDTSAYGCAVSFAIRVENFT